MQKAVRKVTKRMIFVMDYNVFITFEARNRL